MRHVVLPHTYHDQPRPTEAEKALHATGREFMPVYVGDSDRAYFDLLSEMWGYHEDFCVVEQDIVVHKSALDELADCPHDWCAFPYPYMSIPAYYGLGCVKFSAGVMRRHPDAMRRVGVLQDGNHPPRHWCRLDGWLQYVILPSLGEQMHRHETPVTHLGRGCAHGCTTIS